jgi:hypothetical protein
MIVGGNRAEAALPRGLDGPNQPPERQPSSPPPSAAHGRPSPPGGALRQCGRVSDASRALVADNHHASAPIASAPMRASRESTVRRPERTTSGSAGGDSCFPAKEQSWRTGWRARSLLSPTISDSGATARPLAAALSQRGIGAVSGRTGRLGRDGVAWWAWMPALSTGRWRPEGCICGVWVRSRPRSPEDSEMPDLLDSIRGQLGATG